MARYKFTLRDLEPFRVFLEDPGAARVLAAAVPIKQLAGRGTPAVEREIPLAVEVLTREKPDGVPAHELLQAAREVSPEVVSLVVRGGKASVAFSPDVKPEARAQVLALLNDPAALGRKLKVVRGQGSRRPAGAAEPRADLDILFDEEVPDAEWLRAFRRHACAHLLHKPREKKA